MANRSIVGQAKVTFGSFKLAKKYYVQFRKEERAYTLRLYNDKRYMNPCQEVVFGESDFCGLDWGTFETQRVFKRFYFPPRYQTYVTIINKNRSISLLFSDEEEVQLNHWRNELQDCLYDGNHYIREYLRYGSEPVVLQAGSRNLSLTDPRRDLEPAEVRRAQCWDKAMFDRCEADGNILTITMKSDLQPPANEVSVQLECQRSGTIYGKDLSQDDIVRQIWKDVHGWIFMATDITDIAFYEGFPYVIEEYESLDLNELEDTEKNEYQIRRDIVYAYRKWKNQTGDLTNTDRQILTTGAIIARIKATAPQPDTLKLPEDVRCDLCLSLYSATMLDRGKDWTALASQIGIKQSAIRKINALFMEEKPDIYKTEIVLRQWQYTYNLYWDRPDTTPGRPKLPCTREGLIEALTAIRRHDLVAQLETVVERVYERSSSHSQEHCDEETPAPSATEIQRDCSQDDANAVVWL